MCRNIAHLKLHTFPSSTSATPPAPENKIFKAHPDGPESRSGHRNAWISRLLPSHTVRKFVL